MDKINTDSIAQTPTPNKPLKPRSPSPRFYSLDGNNCSDRVDDLFDNTVPTVMPPASPSDKITPILMPPASPSGKITPMLPLDTYHVFNKEANLTIFLVKTDNPYLTHTKLQSALNLGATSLQIVSKPADISRFNLSAKMGWSKESPSELAKLIPFLSRADMMTLAKKLQMAGNSSNLNITAKANTLTPNILSTYTAFSIKADKSHELAVFLNSTKRNVTHT